MLSSKALALATSLGGLDVATHGVGVNETGHDKFSSFEVDDFCICVNDAMGRHYRLQKRARDVVLDPVNSARRIDED